MPDNVKVLIAERNGVDLEYHEEYDFIPENMPFDRTGFTADNVDDAIVEAATGSVSPDPLEDALVGIDLDANGCVIDIILLFSHDLDTLERGDC